MNLNESNIKTAKIAKIRTRKNFVPHGSQLVYLRLVEISNPVKFNLNYLFQVFARPH